jgi:hypothetical protein
MLIQSSSRKLDKDMTFSSPVLAALQKIVSDIEQMSK